jgi:predicted DNA-binding protein (UPF0251 family)
MSPTGWARQVLAKLEATLAEAVRLIYFDHLLTQSQAAKRLGVLVATVRARVAAASARSWPTSGQRPELDC